MNRLVIPACTAAIAAVAIMWWHFNRPPAIHKALHTISERLPHSHYYADDEDIVFENITFSRSLIDITAPEARIISPDRSYNASVSLKNANINLPLDQQPIQVGHIYLENVELTQLLSPNGPLNSLGIENIYLFGDNVTATAYLDGHKAHITFNNLEKGIFCADSLSFSTDNIQRFLTGFIEIITLLNQSYTEDKFTKREERLLYPSLGTENEGRENDDLTWHDYDYFQKSFNLHTTPILERLKSLDITSISITGLHIKNTLDIQALSLSNIDSTGTGDFRVEGLHYYDTPYGYIRHFMKQPELTLDRLQIDRLESVTLYHTLLELAEFTTFFSERHNYWLEDYGLDLLKYFLISPLTAGRVNELEASVTEDNLQIHIHNPTGQGPLKRGAIIHESRMGFDITLKGNPDNISNKTLKEIFRKQEQIDMHVQIFRNPGTSIKRNRGKIQEDDLITALLLIQAENLFTIEMEAVYIPFDLLPPLNALLPATFNLDKIFVMENFDFKLTAENYYSILQTGSNPFSLTATDINISYTDRGLANILTGLPKLNFTDTLEKVENNLKEYLINGGLIGRMLENFLYNPKTLSLKGSSPPDTYIFLDLKGTPHFWSQMPEIHLEINGNSAEAEIRPQ